MRPLIEMLEDERALMQKQEAYYRFLERGDEEVIEVMSIRFQKVVDDLNNVHEEMKEYFGRLLGE